MDSPEKFLEKAREHYRAGEYPEAAEFFQKAHSILNSENRIRLAVALHQAGDSAAAANVYHELAQEDKSLHPAYNAVYIVSLLDTGKQQEALQFARKAFNSNPQEPHYLNDLAYVLEKSGQQQEAIELLRKHHDSVKSPLAGYVLARLLEQQGKTEEACAIREKTAEKYPKHGMTICYKADTLEEQGKIAEAMELCQKKIDSAPPYSPATQDKLARLYEKTGDFAAAAKTWQGIINRYADSPAIRRIGFVEIAREEKKLCEMAMQNMASGILTR